MPNAIINEYDKSTTGVPTYANFSVVVPGFINPEKADAFAAVADSYGVYPCDNQSDFLANVGKYTEYYDPVAPTLYSDEVWPGEPTALESEALLAKAIEFFKKGQLYYAVPNDAHEQEGYLVDENYIYMQVTVEPIGDSFPTLYAIIEAGNEGNAGDIHFGNQIAYELLDLGYTVLFKKLDSIDTLLNKDSANAFFEPLKDRATYNFRYVLNGMLSSNIVANNAISKLATYLNNKSPLELGRGDIIALCDIDRAAYEGTKTLTEILGAMSDCINKYTDSDKFSSLFAPYVSLDITDEEYKNNTVFPASFYYLACAANAFGNLGYNEWWPVAGYERGVSKYTVKQIGYNFGEIAADLLQPRYKENKEKAITKAVNLVIKSHNNYYLYGNRTAHALGNELVYSDFLNIRQLIVTLKKQTDYICKKFTFDPNSSLLWIKVCDGIEPTLKRMKADEGVEDYKFVKVNTKVKATLKGLIRIVPIEGVENFKIGLTLEESIKGAASVNLDELD